MMRAAMRSIIMGGLLLVMPGCGVGSWFGGDDDGARLPGSRIAVLSDSNDVRPDPALAETTVTLPKRMELVRWTQMGGLASHDPGNIAGISLEREPNRVASDEIGEGESWEMSLVPQPVVAAGMIFAVDALGTVSAHALDDPDDVAWRVATQEEETPLPGGGLAYGRGMLVVTNGSSRIVAINVQKGEVFWERRMQFPIRSAPTLSNDQVYVTTVDNQLISLGLADGRILWKHQGLRETTGVLASASVAVDGPAVVVPYSSGELYGLRADTGREIWRAQMMPKRRTSGISRLVDIVSLPILTGTRVYAATRGGMVLALDRNSGIRVWERELSGVQGMWSAATHLFIITSDGLLVCLEASSGRVRWVQPVDPEADEDDRGYWNGPVVMNSLLMVLSDDGRLMVYDPQDGALLYRYDVPSGVRHSPVVLPDRLLLVSRDATLHVLR